MPQIARTPWGVGNAAINMFEEICRWPHLWQCENGKIDSQERRELYDLESLWTVGAEFDDATRLQIFFYLRNSLLGPVGQTKEENLTSQQNMNQCLARSKTSYFSKYSCLIWIDNNWRLDWVTRIMFILSSKRLYSPSGTLSKLKAAWTPWRGWWRCPLRWRTSTWWRRRREGAGWKWTVIYPSVGELPSGVVMTLSCPLDDTNIYFPNTCWLH